MMLKLPPFARPSLRAKIFVLLLSLSLLAAAGALLTLWHAHSTRALLAEAEPGEISPVLAAQVMEAELRQEGADRPDIAGELPDFEAWFRKARGAETLEAGRALLTRIEAERLRLAERRERLREFSAAGLAGPAAAAAREAGERFAALRELCAQYRRLHQEHAQAVAADAGQKTRAVSVLALCAVPATLLLGFWLGWVLLAEVLRPIRRLVLLGAEESAAGPPSDEVRALSRRVAGLISDVDRAQSRLRQSQEHLKQAEKLALVGTLAAGVAHSVRNPLTSVKMRLFSLERGLALDGPQREDFEVISEEIRYLDSIIRNFLEFSRPPKLKMQPVSPSDVVDMTLQLLRHRLESYGAQVAVRRERPLPEVDGDPEQLKEVLANLILNACEAMGEGGRIEIREEAGVIDPHGPMAVVRVSDNGPGIPKAIQEEIFQPFFTTKGEGTGLGLSIARRIMDEHGGWLHLHSQEGSGATFVLALPCRDKDVWLRS
jgi:signal transduction histidine kinase